MAGEPDKTPNTAPQQPPATPETPKPRNKGGRPKGTKGRATYFQKLIRVEATAELLADLHPTGFVINKISKKYKISTNVVERVYIPEAKKLLSKQGNMTPEEARKTINNALANHIRHGTKAEQRAALKLMAEINGVVVTRAAIMRRGDTTVAIAEQTAPAVLAQQERAKLLVDGQPPQKPSLEQVQQWIKEDENIIDISAATAPEPGQSHG